MFRQRREQKMRLDYDIKFQQQLIFSIVRSPNKELNKIHVTESNV